MLTLASDHGHLQHFYVSEMVTLSPKTIIDRKPISENVEPSCKDVDLNERLISASFNSFCDIHLANCLVKQAILIPKQMALFLINKQICSLPVILQTINSMCGREGLNTGLPHSHHTLLASYTGYAY